MGRCLVFAFLLLLPLAASHAAEEPIPFAENEFEWIPWAATLEDAQATAKREKKLLLAFLFPWDGQGFEAGYAGSSLVHPKPPAAPPTEAERLQDPGFVKEQAVLAVLLGNPDLSALVARSFVPVRLRMHTWHFFHGGPGPFADPLPALGTSVRDTRPPAIVVATPDKKLVRRVERMGVFNPHLVHRMLLGVLAENSRFRPDPPKASTDVRTAVEQLAAGGDVAGARARLDRVMPDLPALRWAKIAAARLDAFEGKTDRALTALRELPEEAERDAILAEVLVRRGLAAEVAEMPRLADDPAGRVVLAYALERRGRLEEAAALWRRTLATEPAGPRAARARLHLAQGGPRALEWETLEDHDADPAADTTVGGSGGDADAVRYLLAQQHPDGSWKDARGAGGASDLSVPRTALCAAALRAWRKVVPEDGIGGAIDRAIAYVERWCEAPTAQVWHLTYALHLELDLFEENPTEALRRRAGALLDALGRIEHDGGWTYTGPARLHTFNTAPILLLHVRARALGLTVDGARIGRAAAFLERNRVPKTHVFHYGTTMEHMSGEKGKTDLKSTCMRTAVCELALHRAGDGKSTRGIAEALDLVFAHQDAVRATQKIFESYVDVTSLQDSYRYFFGLWYAAQALHALPEAKRKAAATRLAAIVRAAQEIDGSFVDSQMVGKPSSTALALLTLAECRAARP